MNRCLDGEPELLVVDNASTDQVAEAAAGWKGRSRLIALSENLGFGAASNVGVAEAAGEVTVLLNPDTELLDDGLDRLAATAAELGGLVGPRLLNTDGSVQPSASGPRRRSVALGPGAAAGDGPARRLPGAHRALPARAPAPGQLAHGGMRGRAYGSAAPARAVRHRPAHVQRGRRPRPACRRGRRPVVVRPGFVSDRPPRPGLVDARLRLAGRLPRRPRRSTGEPRSAVPTGRAGNGSPGAPCASTCGCGWPRRRCSAGRRSAIAPPSARSCRLARPPICPSHGRALLGRGPERRPSVELWFERRSVATLSEVTP